MITDFDGGKDSGADGGAADDGGESDKDAGGAKPAGGAAALLDDPDGGKDDGGADGGEDGGKSDDDKAGGGGAKAWYEELVGTEPLDDKGTLPGDWLKGKGFKSFDDMIRSNRELEHKLRNGGKISVPGEDASDEEREAFYKAIGRPDAAGDYDIAAHIPDGNIIDEAFAEPMAEAAFKAGLPKQGFGQLVDAFVGWQLDQEHAALTKEDELREKWEGQQDDLEASRRLVNAGAKAMKWDKDAVSKMQRVLGSDRLLENLKQIGASVAEDVLLPGDKRTFGMTPKEAQQQLDNLQKDAEWVAKREKGDPTATQQFERLVAIIAAGKDREDAG